MAFDKDKYWERRKDGKRGQEGPSPGASSETVPTGAHIGFDNEGGLVLKNRAYRRRRIRLPNSQPTKKKKRK